MLYIGLGMNRELCQACEMYDSGRALSNERFSSTSEELDQLLDKFQDAKFILESTRIWDVWLPLVERCLKHFHKLTT